VGVIGGADLFEHEGPEHGWGGGVCSPWRGSGHAPSRPIAGRSDGCSQPALAELGAFRRIARESPANARTSHVAGIARMNRRLLEGCGSGESFILR
jgi:hypothetical protein